MIEWLIIKDLIKIVREIINKYSLSIWILFKSLFSVFILCLSVLQKRKTPHNQRMQRPSLDKNTKSLSAGLSATHVHNHPFSPSAPPESRLHMTARKKREREREKKKVPQECSRTWQGTWAQNGGKWGRRRGRFTETRTHTACTKRWMETSLPLPLPQNTVYHFF